MSTSPQQIPAPSELVVLLNPSNLLMSEYVGTQAQLEAEGVIPVDTQWPIGFNDVFWHDEHFAYTLHRQRPAGAKGPRKQFLTHDLWCLNWRPFGADLASHRLRNKL